MIFIRRYLIPRLIQYFLVIWLGVTAVFIIPRLLPNDPVLGTIAALRARGGSGVDPAEFDAMVQGLTEMYGLSGSWLDQYGAFWVRLVHGDFGVSFLQFPTKVNALIAASLPWTLGLLLTSTAINWTLGNLMGGLAGYFSRRRWSRVLDTIAMLVRPLPYYIFAFTLLLLFGYVFRVFPIAGGTDIGRVTGFNWPYFQDVLRHSALPLASQVILGGAVSFQTMKLIVQNVNAENFVQYAKLGGLTEDRIVFKYVIQNAMLPQITGLALGLGYIFGGALITEIVFSYPGMGWLLYNAIISGDYNVIMGITAMSIVGVTTAMLVVDLFYPLLDPRIRHM